jgi:hypothetical protein
MGSDAMVHGSISDLIDDARCGSTTVLKVRKSDVRSAHKKGHTSEWPLCAVSGHTREFDLLT